MRDLKHLIYFEDLLQEAHNELVRKGKEDGNLALGYTCYFMPEVLLDLPGCFSVRLRAPRCVSPDMATYYMSGRTCHYGRSLFERALEGGFNFLDAQLATETCTITCRFQEHLKAMPEVINNMNFKVEFSDVPFKKNENSIDHYEKQLKAHVLDFLKNNYGVDTSDEAILKTIEAHNEMCRIIREIGDFRKLDEPTITGYEFAVINLVSMTCPKYLIMDKLKETLEELKTREPDQRKTYRCKVVLAGSENDDPEFTKLIESCGALVVCDRYCYGAVEARVPIEIREGETPLRAIARHYLLTSQCTRFMEQEEMRHRKKFIAELAKEYKADGIIVASNKFCEYWSYERMIDTIVLPRDYGYPVCSIEKEYINSASGQLRTRFQAFVESIEIKKLQEASK
ncbi:MAG: 2-hydroxyacyl-CoA dehydratase [Firmicutes bacterium]|nr:2-hydroxyacyl-CoA dehydratase [Bacillota bacterium]